MKNFWKNKKVLITGNTGFKGSWLSLMLLKMNASLVGYSSDVPTNPSLFSVLGLSDCYFTKFDDVRNKDSLCRIIDEYKIEIIFHLAAQSIVSVGYAKPLETFDVNCIGTATLMEAVKTSATVNSVIIATSDKCYDIKFPCPYREESALGGEDPYSASKATAEIVVNSYRNILQSADRGIGISTVRAGNVIGGGDWSLNRLMPDIIRSLANGVIPVLRNPKMVRPWQHVLDPLFGYMQLAKALSKEPHNYSGPWNFGPSGIIKVTVEQVAKYACEIWGLNFIHEVKSDPAFGKETSYLEIDSTKAFQRLGWINDVTEKDMVSATVAWYYEYYKNPRTIADFTYRQIEMFFDSH